MPSDLPDRTDGSGYAADALPFRDMPEADGAPQFELRDGAVMLRGSRSRSSGGKAFPAREVDLETGARDMEPYLIGPAGTLYSFSTVHVSARPTPYTIGYVDFPDGVRVLAPIDPETDPAMLTCDMPVTLAARDDRWFATPSRAGEAAHV